MSDSPFSFLRRVRIHDGECDAVARALHHQVKSFSSPAALEKVSWATNERKVMSQKTFFKRVAISAISALGFGLLSVVPSQAVVANHSLTIDANADSIQLGETATAVLSHSFVSLTNIGDTVSITALVTSSNSSTAGTVTLRVSDSFTSSANDGSDGNSPFYSLYSGTAAAGTGYTGVEDSSTAGGPFDPANRSGVTGRNTLYISSDETAGRSFGTTISVDLYNPTAVGTYTVEFFTQVASGTSPSYSSASTPTATWTVTVTAPSVLATSASTATLRGQPANSACAASLNTTDREWCGTGEASDSSVVTPRVATTSTTDAVAEGVIYVLQKNTTGPSSANYAQESFTVTVSGEAFVTAADGTRPSASGGVKSRVFATPTRNTPVAVYLWSTGTAGTASVTITTSSGVAIGGTKTLTFSGPVTTLAVSRDVLKYLPAGTAGSLGTVFRVKATDAGGRDVSAGITISAVTSNAAVVGDGTCSILAGDPSGTYLCSATGNVLSTSGQTATLTARVQDPAVTSSISYITAPAYAVTMGDAINTATLTFDKATYAPGEAMRITVTAKDSSGNVPYDGIGGFTLTANKAIGGTITMNAFYDGVSDTRVRTSTPRTYTTTENLFAPAASGEFRVTGTFTNAAGVSTLISGTAKVSDDGVTQAVNAAADAALEAIDAANAATDAANLAAEAADAATVAAEEARDAADAATAAVEALATEVATLMAALKAQITTLANTVAKIAKKVKA